MNDTQTPEQLRDIAIAVARAGARTIRAHMEKSDVAGQSLAAVRTKSSAVDPVTEVDTAAEETIVAELIRRRPHDEIIGEEGTGREGSTGISWVVDPIDGTVNFLYGIGEFAVSVGAVVDGEPVAGAVINVASDQLYSAAQGAGAYMHCGESAHQLRCTTVTDITQTLVATGFAYLPDRRQRQGEIVTKLLATVRDIRRMGSAALDLCRVAQGHVDAYYEAGLHAWDWTAGIVIAREAGAKVWTPEVSSPGSRGEVVCAAAPGIATDFHQCLSHAGGMNALPDRNEGN